jgi:hypothetical protein
MSILMMWMIVGFVIPAMVMFVVALLEPALKRYHHPHHPM